MKINTTGVYDMSAEDYHADPCETPSLSRSIAVTIAEQTPAHAVTQHPRLSEIAKRTTQKDHFSIGQLAHALMLKSDDEFVVIDENDWRKKVAQAKKAEALHDGKTPILRHQYEQVCEMVKAGKDQLALHDDSSAAFTDFEPEKVLIWEEDGVWLRIRLDELPNNSNIFHDYKTTGQSADPFGLSRSLSNLDYDFQCAFYRRGIKSVLGIDARFKFVVQEVDAPYCLSVVEWDTYTKQMADARVERAIMRWRWCMQNNKWPGHVNKTATIEVPTYLDTKRHEIEQIENDENLTGDWLDNCNAMKGN